MAVYAVSITLAEQTSTIHKKWYTLLISALYPD